MDNSNIRHIIIGRSSCPFCIMAVDFCVASQIPYIFLDYPERPDIIEDYKEFYTQDTVPIILKNDIESGETQKVGGYTDLLNLWLEEENCLKKNKKRSK